MKGPIIYTAVAAMTLQQALATMGGLTVPLLAPPIAAETGLNPSLVGLYTAFLYGGATISSLIGGGFLLRYGALRLSQVCLLVISLGLLLSLSSSLLLFVFGAIIIGLGLGPATPASSQILARYAKPANAPLMFSIKQTGVPLGGILAGSLLPLCVSSFGWQGAIFMTALMVIILTVLLQPLRAEFDSDRQQNREFQISDVRKTLSTVLKTPGVPLLAISLFSFTGIQMAFAAFFVSFLAIETGWSLSEAGVAFSISMAAGIFGRILWGWVSTRYIRPLTLLAALGAIMGVTCMIIGTITPAWDTHVVFAVAFAFGLTGIGYQGVLLAEIARISPAGLVGVVTGGVVFFACLGMMVLPGLLGLILELFSSYRVAFISLGLIPILVSLTLLRSVLRAKNLRNEI